MKKILSINENPVIRTYTHHGYLHSIISSSDKVNYDSEEPVASLTVKNYALYNWKIENENMKYKVDEDGRLNAYCNQWNLGMNLSFWRTCQENDKMEITILKQLFSNARSSITLFLEGEQKSDLLHIESCGLRVGNSSRDGIYYAIDKGIEANVNVLSVPKYPLNLILTKENRMIYLEYSDETMINRKILVKEISEEEELTKIGFCINFGDSSFYDWLFSNYIQIYCNVDKPMPIEYMCNVHKNWHCYTTNYFVDYSFITVKEIEENGYQILDYIETQINQNRYLETVINDKLHVTGENNLAFKNQNLVYGNEYNDDSDAPFFHQDLIYGYDNGKPMSAVMTYSEFLSKRNETSDRWFFLMKYNPGIEKYTLSPKHLLQLFREYRDGINISYYEPELEQGYMIGLNCFNFLCTEMGVNAILSDIRISYLLYERSLCNKERVLYLKEKGIINECYSTELLQVLDNELLCLNLVKRLALKAMLGGESDILFINKKLEDIYECEENFVNSMIEALTQ